MFLFINRGEAEIEFDTEFKYISCFYLSRFWQPMSRRCCEFKYISCFYLSFDLYTPSKVPTVFKYISCFYLSYSAGWFAFTTSWFKYISCFYLSWRLLLQTTWQPNSDTSHVFIYLYKQKQENVFCLIFKYISCFYLSANRERRD